MYNHFILEYIMSTKNYSKLAAVATTPICVNIYICRKPYQKLVVFTKSLGYLQ